MDYSELNDLSLEQLRLYKRHIVDEIKSKQKLTRELDKRIKAILIANNNVSSKK